MNFHFLNKESTPSEDRFSIFGSFCNILHSITPLHSFVIDSPILWKQEYRDLLGLLNLYRLIRTIVTFECTKDINRQENIDYRLWRIVYVIHSRNYDEESMSMIYSSHYLKLLVLANSQPDKLTLAEYREIIKSVVVKLVESLKETTFEECYDEMNKEKVVDKNNCYYSYLMLIKIIGIDTVSDAMTAIKKSLFKLIDGECK